MAEFLFITPQEMASTTILGGNVDIDKYLFCIANVQLTIIEPLLGTELYDKILTDAENDELTGLYETMYNDYVKPITKNKAIAEYIEIGQYMVDNGGIYKHTGENIEVVSKDEVMFLSNKYNAYAQMLILRFNKWICNNTIPEFKTYQDDVNANRNIKVTAGWKLNYNNLDDRKWYLQ
jgi:hypothetical protein